MLYVNSARMERQTGRWRLFEKSNFGVNEFGMFFVCACFLANKYNNSASHARAATRESALVPGVLLIARESRFYSTRAGINIQYIF